MAIDYNSIRNNDFKKGISYEKQSKIASIFTRKWYDKCRQEFVVLDFETTGLDKVYDRIIEIAAIRYVNGEEKEKYVTLVNPRCSIPAEATAVHHITNSMIKNAPLEKEAIPKLIRFIGDSLLVGHNVNFDVGFLEIAAQRHGMNVKYDYIDTLSVSKKMFPGLPDYKLGTIANSLSFDTSKLHRAEADVYVCAEIIKITLDTLSCDFEETAKRLKSVKTTQSKITSNEAARSRVSLQQALVRDGLQRKSFGQHLVIVSRHNGSCENCKRFENCVLIDDVYSGGSRADGNYPLLSDAIKQGLFHDGCRHGISTYYPEINKIDSQYSNSQTVNIQNNRNKWVVFILCLLFGYLGIHKFYEGKTGMGILYLLTFGLFGVGWLVDLILILLKIISKEK